MEEPGSKGVEDVVAMGWILGGGDMIWCTIEKRLWYKEAGTEDCWSI